MANPKTTTRTRKSRTFRQRLVRVTIHLFMWTGAAVLYYIGFSLFFDTPVEYGLKHSTDRLRDEYGQLAARYDTLERVLNNVVERDRNVFGILFESDPYDFEADRDASAGYEALFTLSTRCLLYTSPSPRDS